MATAARTRKPKSVLDRERHTAEFTSGQLVIAICSLLMAALLCFLLGVLVGRYERSIEHRQLAQHAAGEAEALAQAPPPAPPASSPAPVSAAAQSPPVQAPPPEPARPPETPPVVPVTPPIPEPVPDPPASVRQHDIIITPLPDTPTPPSTPAPPAASATRTPEQPPASTTAEGPRYGIQVAAFSDTENAQRALARLVENTGLEAELAQSGQWVRVIVGNYARREDAEAACEELRERAGFRDSYVVARPN